ncbi:MAG: hypothetical protein JSU70_09560 [Phycisphaerales bacterium]|nr:MAG: hypothetical protein JSU70_09560 [Phycisphaerales bacterium]
MRKRFITGLLCFLSLLALAGSGQAQISIEGVTDRKVYGDSVSFKVSSEEGFDYTVELNGNPVATDVSIEVDEPEYYELYVYRREQSSGAEQSELVQFIVRATERGNSEWGLPLWTPYPAIDSAAAEFADARLKIVTPAQYPMGLEIPVIARVQDDSGNRLGVNGAIEAAGFADHPLQLLRGVGSVFLPAAQEPGAISYAAEIESLQTAKQIAIEASTIWQTVSEDIATSTDWGENARIHISGVTGDVLTIAPGATLTIGAASVIIIDPDITVDVQGKIVVNGTEERPVVFTAQDRSLPWGGFLFESGSSEGQLTNAILTASGADPDWFGNNPGHGGSHRKNQCLFYLSDGAHVTLTDCYLVENHGQAGHGESSYLTMAGCLVQKCVTGGQYNRGSVVLEDCALIEFPSAAAAFADDDNDALYLTGGAHSLTDCLVGWALDDGVDAGSGAGGPVAVHNCWFESCYHEAMAWSEPRIADVTDTVVLNCGQGIECGFGSPDVNAVHCLSTANAVGARFGDNYDWSYHGFLKVSDSLLLFNLRDVWGRAWDDWTVHLSQMDIRNNYLSVPNANYPDNQIWDPRRYPAHRDELEPFLGTDADTVGIGFATLGNTLPLSQLSSTIPVRLSTFTTNSVSVGYAVYADGRPHDSGSLEFAPGETVKHIQLTIPPLGDPRQVRAVLSNPVNAELTGHQKVTYVIPYELVEPLILEGDQWRYFKGTEEPPADWNLLSFDDATWLLGRTGMGYETGTGYEPCINTNLSDMRNNYISVYARRPFFVDDPSRLTSLTLSMDFDDGYIAYINGAQVADQYAPDPPTYDQRASSHEACCNKGSCSAAQIDLSDRTGELVAGINVLAVQVHNQSLSSSDFLFIPELSAVVTPWPGDVEPDGDVDLDDFAVLAAAWLAEDGEGRYNSACDISIPADGYIDTMDLMIFVDNWLAGF